MPAVTLWSKPNGEPMASTHSPTFRRAGSPIFTVGSEPFFEATFSSAMSLRSSEPINLAGSSLRSPRRTMI